MKKYKANSDLSVRSWLDLSHTAGVLYFFCRASSEKAEEPHVVAPPHALCRVNRQLLLELKEQTLAEEEQPQEASQRLERSVTRLVDQFYSSASCLNAAYIDYQRSYQQGRVGYAQTMPGSCPSLVQTLDSFPFANCVLCANPSRE